MKKSMEIQKGGGGGVKFERHGVVEHFGISEGTTWLKLCKLFVVGY